LEEEEEKKEAAKKAELEATHKELLNENLSETDKKILLAKLADQKMEEERQNRNEAKIQAENAEKLKRFEELQKK